MKGFLQQSIEKYKRVTPTLTSIENIFNISSELSSGVYDHIAFRTFKCLGGITIVSNELEKYGYVERGCYEFPTKKLRAKWYLNQNDLLLPRIFVSQIEDNLLSELSQYIIRSNVDSSHSNLIGFSGSINEDEEDGFEIKSKVPSVSFSEYHYLKQESQYAAWTLIHGTMINHVAFSISNLKYPNMPVFDSLENINTYVKNLGISIVEVDGKKINVSRDGLLKQSSTVADSLRLPFRNHKYTDDPDFIEVNVGGGFVEFIDRQKEGFDPENPLNIFESTNIKNKQ
jgi:hypothetical protein